MVGGGWGDRRRVMTALAEIEGQIGNVVALESPGASRILALLVGRDGNIF